MVFREFQNINVECWLHRERLGKSAKSLCLFHSALPDGSVLLKALDDLLADEVPARRRITFIPNSRPRTVSTLCLCFVPISADLRVLEITCQDDIAQIDMTPIGLPLIRDGIDRWCAGGEDFGVSAHHSDLPKRELGDRDESSMELWFWGPTYDP